MRLETGHAEGRARHRRGQSSASLYLSPTRGDCAPFLKWAGGKTQLLAELDAHLPTDFDHYYEPFAGSAAVFFHLRRRHGLFPATLMDSNAELINSFQMVQDSVEALIPLLKEHRKRHGKRYYYAIRAIAPETLAPVERAARFIYLNKVCYNGLYRVNSKGQFNVPMGSYKNPRIFNEAALRAISQSLQNVELRQADFGEVSFMAGNGDSVYLDPPYYSDGSGFTGYAVAASGKAKFAAGEHRRLAEVVKELHEKGCSVVLSNSDTEYVRRLYKSFTIHVVQARRLINCRGSGRGRVNELVITNQ